MSLRERGAGAQEEGREGRGVGTERGVALASISRPRLSPQTYVIA